MSNADQTRAEWLTEQYPDTFDTEREGKLPVWAQVKLNRLRSLLLAEAADNDGLRADIERHTLPFDLRKGEA
ncbi:hypothetical protein [Streptomyces olivaceus]|uniref:hypothetical protein n=1 Tax=Streptomyces olivaceus TaxID=47716 RepID=UPI0036E04E1C